MVDVAKVRMFGLPVAKGRGPLSPITKLRVRCGAARWRLLRALTII